MPLAQLQIVGWPNFDRSTQHLPRTQPPRTDGRRYAVLNKFCATRTVSLANALKIVMWECTEFIRKMMGGFHRAISTIDADSVRNFDMFPLRAERQRRGVSELHGVRKRGMGWFGHFQLSVEIGFGPRRMCAALPRRITCKGARMFASLNT